MSLKAKRPRDWNAIWAELLADMPFHFLFLGLLIGCIAFGFLFEPVNRSNWMEAWLSKRGLWALLWWTVSLVCISCAVRGFKLRLYRWRQRKAHAEADAESSQLAETTAE